MAQTLFNRAWSVSFGPPGNLTYVYKNLRTTFEIEKNSLGSSNKAKIKIYNLSGTSRNTFQKGYNIQLQAGYVGNDPDSVPLIDTIFSGNIIRLESKREGADIVTEFECGDSEKQIATNVFSKTYPPGTTYVQIVTDLANTLGVNVGVVIGIQNFKFSSAVTKSGSVSSILTELLKKQGLEWSIQNGVLQIVPTESHSGAQAIVLSNRTGGAYPGLTGLVGVPSRNGDLVGFKALLNPKIKPDSMVQIVSESVNGFFKVRKAKFEGDTHGDKWDVDCEGCKISAIQNLPFNTGTNFNTAVIA